MIEHGTLRGWQQHSRSGTPFCDPCRKARNAYTRERRKDPKVMARHKASERARSSALILLSREFQDRYKELYKQERTSEYKKRGLTL